MAGIPDQLLVFNGVDADTGRYLFEPTALASMAEGLRAAGTPSGRHLREIGRRRAEEEESLGLVYGRDPEDLGQAGWALVCADGADPLVLEALEPLRQLRRRQAGELYREFAVRAGEDDEAFRSRHRSGPGPVDPRRVPYYLLIVGGPDEIPFQFQYQLDVTYAVGRIHFDTAEEYASYAASVVAAEDGPAPAAAERQPQAHLFGTRNPGDTATALSASRLVDPLASELTVLSPDVAQAVDVGAAATKARLSELLLSDPAPHALFTATHGIGLRADRLDGERQRETQGALLCQDWPGPLKQAGPISDGHYLSGQDVPTDRPVGPRVVVSFCCYGAGTPGAPDFGQPQGEPSRSAGGRPFVARLPQRLLGTPAGGALAFVGHVDRAWGYSFLWNGTDPQITAMASMLGSLLEGVRLGAAMEFLNSRYAEISTQLTAKLDAIHRAGLVVEDQVLARLWTANNDARNYVVLGDPAVRAVRPAGTAHDDAAHPPWS